jgi:hypothetical protein
MARTEINLLNRMRRLSAILTLIIFFMSIWIKNLYDDIDWIRYENTTDLLEKSNEVNTIRRLNHKIDSLEKLNVKVVEKPKERRKKITTKIDSVSVIPIDIIKSDTIK